MATGWTDGTADSWAAGAPAAMVHPRLSGGRPEHRPGFESLFSDLRSPLGGDLAQVEAERCLVCGGPTAPAPCVAACPAGVDVPGFVSALAAGRRAEAAATVFDANLLGGTCARVCPVEELCEGACVLARQGRRPVEIARLQRYATELVPPPRRAAPPTGKRVAVIGAGPAGLVCAGELAARGHSVTLYEGREEFGGLVRYAIAPYRQVREPLPDEVWRILGLGVALRLGAGIDSPDRLREIEREVDAIVLAVGMGPDVRQPYPGDTLRGVWDSLDFIERIKLGNFPAVGARVAVIGGGNTAIDVAREAVRLGASEVTLLYRRGEAEMPAYRFEVEGAKREGVRFLWLTDPIGFDGTDRLTGVRCRVMRLGDPDPSGRPRPVPVPGSEFVLPAHTAVKAIGQRPRLEFLSWIEGLELDGGRPRIDPATGQCTNSRYFAAGDVVSGGATVVAAVRGAKIAARGADRWLRREAEGSGA